ncbi:unnamed protein product [Rhodiola kirilowii]
MKGVVPIVRNRIPESFKPRTVFVPQTLDNWGEIEDNPCHRSIIVQSFVESDGDGSVADEREEALESVLEAEERLEDVKSEVEKGSWNFECSERCKWIQFRHLEQALMGVLVVARMPLLLDQHLSQNIPAIKLYWSKVLHQVNMLLSAVKKYHLQLQDFVRQEMEKTQLTAFYTSEELVFFLASGLLTLPIYLDDATGSFSLMPSTDAS